MKSSNRKLFFLSLVLVMILCALVPVLSGCASSIEVDTSGMYLVVYEGNEGYLGNKTATVRKMYCEPGSKIPYIPVEYTDNQYTVPSLGLAMREGFDLLGWYASDAATYKESENGEFVYLSADDGNGIFEINPNGEYVRKYEKADDGEYVYVFVEEAEKEEGSETEAAPDTYVFISSKLKNEEEPAETDDAELPSDETAEDGEQADAETEETEETAEPDENVIVLSVESGFYICNGDETINEIDDENLREAYRRAYEKKTYSLTEVSSLAGWQKVGEIPEAYADVTAELDRYAYVFAKAEESDVGLDRYAIESGYVSLYTVFVENENGKYVFETPYYVDYDAENEAHAKAQRYSVSDRIVFTPDGDKTNPSYFDRFDATMDYWDFANDTVTEDKCEWDGEKYVLTLNAHWVKKNTVYFHYDNAANQIDSQWTRLLADNYTAVPIRPGEIIGRKEMIPKNAGQTFVCWSKTQGEYDPWNFETDLFPAGETELHLYAYYIDGTYTRITSASGLASVAKDPAGKYLIANDIDFGGKELTASPLGLKADDVFSGEIIAFDKKLTNFTLKLSPSKQQTMDSSIITSVTLIPQASGAKIIGLEIDGKAVASGIKGGVKGSAKKDIRFAVSPLFGKVLADGVTEVKDCKINFTLTEKSEDTFKSDTFNYVINCGALATEAARGKLSVENTEAEFVAEITDETVKLIEYKN